MTRLDYAPGRRLTFLACELQKVTRYPGEDRDGNSIWIYRHTFRSPSFPHGLIVYSGKSLQIPVGEKVAIKGTIKRLEKFGCFFLRISRPILLDNPAPLPLEGI